jgi:hypothetical protein
VGDDLALPSVLNTVPDIEYTRDTGDESLIKVAFSKSVHVQPITFISGCVLFEEAIPMRIDSVQTFRCSD